LNDIFEHSEKILSVLLAHMAKKLPIVLVGQHGERWY
jgi:hypothetical protein